MIFPIMKELQFSMFVKYMTSNYYLTKCYVINYYTCNFCFYIPSSLDKARLREQENTPLLGLARVNRPMIYLIRKI